MPTAAVLPDDALWRPWADLPSDLLRDISRRLHTTTDYVRFHATCKPWRNTLPPAPCYPAFLPWLLAPPDSTNHRKARCVFSSSKATRRGTSAAMETLVRDQRWVISLADGAAVSTLTDICCGGLTGPLPGSAASASNKPLPLPPFLGDHEAKWWADSADGVVSSDGTILLYLSYPVRWTRWLYMLAFNAAILCPGDAAWTMVRQHLHLDPCSCVAHLDGKIIIRQNGSLSSSYIEIRQIDGSWSEWDIDSPLPSEYRKASQFSYLFESRGELLLANVRADHARRHTMASFVEGMSVSVHELQETQGGKMQWVKRDGWSLADRIMFLGRPRSFAVDAASFGEISGGCAYFVIKSELYTGVWSTKRCRVFRYSFQDNKSELVEQLPVEWDEDACMWLTPPQPYMDSSYRHNRW